MTDEDDEATDGGEAVQNHTIRLELVDKPGELLRALEPIAENGGNLQSIFHERGSLTPRGHIPVEIDLECPPDRFERILDALRENGVNVIQADAERYDETLTVILTGHLIDADLSATLSAIESATVSVTDVSLSAPEGTAEYASARLRLAATEGSVVSALERLRSIAAERDLHLIEPLVEGR
ncbi:amino acid-binding protein [Halobacteriaceae archaeon GCM10025711]